MPVFIIFGLIYYLPAVLFWKILKNQNEKTSIYKNRNSKISGLQSFLVFLIYFILTSAIGYSLSTTYVVIQRGLIDHDLFFFFLVILVPNLIQFFNSLIFLPKYWNPSIGVIYRQVLLIAFLFLNIYITIKITSIRLNSGSMADIFFIFGALPALPSFFVYYFLVAKSSKPDPDYPPKLNGFFSWKLNRRLILLAFVYIIILTSERAIVYFGRVSLGIPPSNALNVSRDDLLTNENYILGDDKNKNLIRDDYEIWIDKNFTDYDEKMALLQYGKTHYWYMKATIVGMKKIKEKKELNMVNLLPEDSDLTEYYVRQNLFWSGNCIDYVFRNNKKYRNANKHANEILINNKDRYDVDKIAHFSGGGFNIPDYEGCSFIMKNNMNSAEIISKNLRNNLILAIEKNEIEKVKELSKQVSSMKLEDYMVAQIATTALLNENENILDSLFNNGIDFRKKFRDNIYAFLDSPYDIAKSLGAKKSLEWFDSKYK